MSEISVEMRLKLDKLKADAAKGGKEIRDGLASSVKGLTQTSIEREDRARAGAAKRQSQSMAERLDLFKQNYEVEMASRRNRASALNRQRDEERTAKEVEAASRRNQARALLRQREEDKVSAAQKAQKENMIALAKTVAVVVGAFLILKKVVGEMAASADAARKTYAKILQSGGMASGFIVKREQLANILGVSEDQVMQYGNAINYLNSKLDWSSKILTETNPTLTALGWQFKILDENMKAAWASIVTDAVPAIKALMDAVNGLVKGIPNASKDLIDWPIRALKAQAFTTQQKGLNGAAFEEHDDKTQSIKFVPITGGQFSDKMQKSLQELFAKFLGQSVPKAPPPNVSIDRMPASTWEKMGLVIGNSGNQNHLMKIAANTKKTADAVVQLAQAVIQRGQTTGIDPKTALYPAP